VTGDAGDGRSRLLAKVERYYAGRLREHGATARGVDWPTELSQQVRFEQLARILPSDRTFTINDVGCGYGGLVEFLDDADLRADYLGVDVSPSMIQAARERHGTRAAARFEIGSAPDRIADFAVASGIFNVRLDEARDAWEDYVFSSLDVLDGCARAGFAFNCLTSYSDPERMRDDLYYADPCRLFDRCKRRFARNVALLHDYGLYEFTILVRKEP
jgi:SAM-dependent methyltransferase